MRFNRDQVEEIVQKRVLKSNREWAGMTTFAFFSGCLCGCMGFYVYSIVAAIAWGK